MSETSENKSRPKFRVSCLTGTLIIVLAIVLIATLGPMCASGERRTDPLKGCQASLKGLSLCLCMYAEDHEGQYPPAETWCDLLAQWVRKASGESVEEFRRTYRCPLVSEEDWGYALNPLAKHKGDPDVVLVFESDAGWNGFGGPELLAGKRHGGKGHCVLFADHSVRFVKAEELTDLKWKDEFSVLVPNARRPHGEGEMHYWLRNMVVYHRFSTEEVRLATGLTAGEIEAAQGRFSILAADRPAREPDAPLLVLPYPGGRHPRIGFLEGAIDPQRETKFSVFTPWDPNSYVVVDVPEAIWSNLGLTYLAHTHIDTIWSAQGIELEKLEWTRQSDGGLEIERALPNGLAFGVKVRPTKQAVHMEMWMKNGTTEPLSGLRIQNCVMSKMAAGFADQTNENKVLTNPYVACRSEDGKRWIITAWEGCDRPWANEDCPCFHSDPKFPDLELGQTHTLRGWLSFYEGEDTQAEFQRIEATGWRQEATISKP